MRMAGSMFRPKPHVDVLRRVFDLSGHGMTRLLAESILALDFPEGDAARIDELNARANEGTLTSEEEAELEAYVNIISAGSSRIGNRKLVNRQSQIFRRLEGPVRSLLFGSLL